MTAPTCLSYVERPSMRSISTFTGQTMKANQPKTVKRRYYGKETGRFLNVINH